MDNEKIVSDVLQKKIKDLEDLLKIQCSDGNWNYNEYMHGMANGMILSMNILENDYDNPYTGQKCERPFLEAPDKWLKDAIKSVIEMRKRS
jgi:hypothetical protein